MSFKQLFRLFHTIRYLRPKQIAYRFYYLFHKATVPPLQENISSRTWVRPWSSPQWQPSFLHKEGEFEFLGVIGQVRFAGDWNNPTKCKLWLYNLHYLDELNTQDADQRCDMLHTLIEEWITNNPPLEGNGWEPYTLSLRLVNLVKWHTRHPSPNSKLLSSIQQQAMALTSQLEYHIMANHLFSNGKALVFVGTLLDSQQGDKFLQLGLTILDKEIQEQFLPDGAHFELSPMYHAILLWDLCDLIKLSEVSGATGLQKRIQQWHKVVERGLLWLSTMLHPDGDIPFFNDATFGIAPSYKDLSIYSLELGIKFEMKVPDALSVSHLQESGYIAIHINDTSKALLDVACVGVDYQPGHAHADTLSFELSLFKQRIIVNSGISQYGAGTEREYQRSTQAHNTMVVDNKNSSDVWAGFRVARRAYPKKLEVKQKAEQVSISCSHNGYQYLPGNVIHQRQWFVRQNECTLIDKLSGRYQQADIYYYFHPDIQIQEMAIGIFQLTLQEGQQVLLSFHNQIKVTLSDSTWHPGFGLSIPNNCLKVEMAESPVTTRIKW